MSVFYIIGFVIILVVLRQQRRGKPKVDYSFGLAPAKQIVKWLRKKNYPEAESGLLKLTSDELSVTLDYIALNLAEKNFTNWCLSAKNKDISLLAKGVFYLHYAWKVRGYQRASKLSQKQGDRFVELLNKSMDSLEAISETFLFKAEVYWRCAAIHKAVGETEEVISFFQKAKRADASLVMNYVEYAAAVQPKWGGNLNLVQELLAEVPEDTLVGQILRLRYFYECEIEGVHLLGGVLEEVEKDTQAFLVKVDEHLTAKPPESIHRFLLYNLMWVLAEDMNKKPIAKKYKKLMNGYYTLYPHGMLLYK